MLAVQTTEASRRGSMARGAAHPVIAGTNTPDTDAGYGVRATLCVTSTLLDAPTQSTAAQKKTTGNE